MMLQLETGRPQRAAITNPANTAARIDSLVFLMYRFIILVLYASTMGASDW
ncbi:hypothetical protein [Desulforhopalus singaporensis]|uniref:hypothetical protein n=1 Tax=Desulforhopalus singaporensis TaxID=91360 RepID=UPI0015A18AA1|nr:hypothetical protein [Desulforhopalus singaporensis]